MSESETLVSPKPSEYLATGVVGSIVNLLIASVCLWSLQQHGLKSRTSRRFFVLILAMSVLELPRFVAMAKEENYASQACYSCHIVASSLFFISFSIICYQWAGLLKMGTYVKLFYGLKGLIVVNFLFGAVDLFNVVECLRSRSLMSYFESDVYVVLTFLEASRNLTYSLFLSFYGIKLVLKFWQYSKMEKSVSAGSRGEVSGSSDNSDHLLHPYSPSMTGIFQQTVLRLVAVLAVCFVCFFLRLCMLAAKIAVLQTDYHITSSRFRLFGFFWFLFSDFIPRVVPTVSFIILMRTKRLPKEAQRTLSQGNLEDDFQFIRLGAGGEMDRGGETGGLLAEEEDDCSSLFGDDCDEEEQTLTDGEEGDRLGDEAGLSGPDSDDEITTEFFEVERKRGKTKIAPSSRRAPGASGLSPRVAASSTVGERNVVLANFAKRDSPNGTTGIQSNGNNARSRDVMYSVNLSPVHFERDSVAL